MSFANSARRFAQQVGRERAQIFGGTEADGTCLADGSNLSFESNGAVRRFRAAFQERTSRELVEHGEQLVVGAVVSIPQSLNLGLVLGSRLTHLSTGKIYVVEDIKPAALSGESRCELRRLED